MSRRIVPILAALVAVLFIGYTTSHFRPWPAAAANITVNTPIDADAFDALCSLREAIIAANTDAAYKECAGGSGADTISFSFSGTITLTSNLPNITDAAGLTINGAGAITINGAGLWRAFNIAGTGVLTLQSLTVTNNLGSSGGGAILNLGTVTVTNSTINGNSAGASFGGGIYNIGTMTLTNSAVSGNTTTTPGGGIFNSGNLTLTNSTVSGNTAGAGGGIFNDGTMTLTNSTVSGNSATGGAGGVLNNGTLTLTNSTVSGNTAAFAGGGIFNSGTATLSNSTLNGNTAGTAGGGIYNQGNLTLTNTTLSGNTALQPGGGIYNAGTASLTNVTISGNTAATGSGIWQSAIAGMPLTLLNTIVANNTGTNCVGNLNSLGYNLSSDTTCTLIQTGDLPNNAGANLGPLANNGGPTQTRALLAGSAAIDAASPACPPPATDQRGITRPQDGNSDGTARCDIGAYELQAPAAPTLTPTATGTVIATATATRTATPIIVQRPPALGAFPLAGATGTERNLARAAAEAQAAAAGQAQAGLAPDPRAAVGPSLLRPPNTGDGGLAGVNQDP